MALVALVAVLASCENTDPTIFSVPSGPVSLSHDVQPIFTQSCVSSGCHDATRSQQLDLRAGATYEPRFGIVGIRSTEAMGLLRVSRGASDASYLVNKLEGTQRSVNGTGTAMPPTGALSNSTIETIRRWIDEGAHDN